MNRLMSLTASAVVGMMLLAASVSSAQDAINLPGAAIYDSPNVAAWPITVHIDSITMSPTGDTNPGLAFTLSGANWPDYTPPGWEGPIQYTVWACELPQLYCAGFIQMWRGRPSTGAPILTDFHLNWAYDANRWGPLANYIPKAGDNMAFFVTAGNGRGADGGTLVQARSQVVVVRIPVGDSGVFDFPVTPGMVTPPTDAPRVPADPPVVVAPSPQPQPPVVEPPPPVASQPVPEPLPAVPTVPVAAPPVQPPSSTNWKALLAEIIGGFLALLFAISAAN